MKGTTQSRILWVIRAFGNVPDLTLERVLKDLPGSTVRGARKRLQARGVIECTGRTRDGRKKWGLAPPRSNPAPHGV